MHPLYTYAAGNAITFRSDKVVSETEGLGSREQAIWRWKPVLAALWMAYLLDAGALARTLPISVGLKKINVIVFSFPPQQCLVKFIFPEHKICFRNSTGCVR